MIWPCKAVIRVIDSYTQSFELPSSRGIPLGMTLMNPSFCDRTKDPVVSLDLQLDTIPRRLPSYPVGEVSKECVLDVTIGARSKIDWDKDSWSDSD